MKPKLGTPIKQLRRRKSEKPLAIRRANVFFINKAIANGLKGKDHDLIKHGRKIWIAEMQLEDTILINGEGDE